MEVVAVESMGSDMDSMLDSQRDLFCRQVEALQKIVVIQCRLTGVNPLSQEMAAGALSINIGKRPRDLLNPKAVKYMQSVFSIKDSIGKKESREISALCGVTVTQVREYFAGQRSGVRKSIRLSREKAAKTREIKPFDNCIMCYSSNVLENSEHAHVSSIDDKIGEELPGPFVTAVKHTDGEDTNHLGPANSKSGQECNLSQKESIPDINFEDKKFLENIFSLMRKEQTFSGQTKLLEWVTQINNSEILYWFLTKGGATILASWLNQSALEEQTSMILVIFKVLCHLPLHKALPVHLSSILQTVNKLRFYRMSDISNKARFLLSRWSKLLVRSQAVNSSLLKPNGANKELLRKQRISEILSDETWETKVEIPEEILVLAQDSSESTRQVESGQILKLLPAPCDDSSKKNGRIVSVTKTKERRKVLMVEQPDSAISGRSVQVSRAVMANKSRPLCADDIQKAKMRAFFLQQGKHGKTGAATSANCLQNIKEKRLSSAFKQKISASRLMGGELTKSMDMDSSHPVSVSLNDLKPGAMFQFSMEKLTSIQISWQKPPEMTINVLWSLGYGGNSKEFEIQTARNRREQEENYPKADEIPENPKEPWDMEMDFDDSLTPQIPAEQFSDEDDGEAATNTNGTAGTDAAIFSGNSNMDCSAAHAVMGNSMSYPSQLVEHLNTGDSSVSISMPFSLQTEHVRAISSLPFPSQGDNITVANTDIVSSSAFLSQIENVNVGYFCANDSAPFPAQVDRIGVGNSQPLESKHASIGNTPMSSSEPFESHIENTRMSYLSTGNPMAYPSQTLHESTRNYKPFQSYNKDLGVDNSDVGNLPSQTENASTSNSMSILSKLDDVRMNKSTSRPLQSSHGNKVVGPDIELLAVLLKNPELVFALTSGQANGMTDAQTVALLDMIKKASSTQNRISSQQTHGNEQPDTTRHPSPIPPTTAVGERMQQPDTIATHLIVPSHQSESARELSIIHAATAQPCPYLTPNELNEVTPPVQMNPLPTCVPSCTFMPLPSSQSLMSYDIPIHQSPANNFVRGEPPPSFVPQANGHNLAVTSPAQNGSAVPSRMESKSLTPSTVGYSSQASASRTPSNFRSRLPSMQPFPVNQPRMKHPASLGEPSSSRAALHEMSPAAGRTSVAIPPVTKYFDNSFIDDAAGYNKSRLSSRQSRRHDYDQYASQSLRSSSMHSYTTAASSIDEYDDRELDREEAMRLQHRYVEDDYRTQPRRKASGWDDHRRDLARPYYSKCSRHSPVKRRWRDRDRRH